MSTVEERIETALQEITKEKHVHILYACESGSRAWGFASQDSDYDVRFLYVRPKEAYLRLDVPRDVIEYPIVDELDISGWDIFKALRLLRKSNPPLMEWLFSPIVYLTNSAYINALRGFAWHHYSSNAVFYYYRHMAERNYRQYIKDKAPVLMKKYLYVLRPLAALLYLEQFHVLPPTNFSEMLSQIHLSELVQSHIEGLVERKKQGEELEMETPDSILNAFIDNCLEKWKTPAALGFEYRASQAQIDVQEQLT